MRFSGFADEAGAGIEKQISATKELGWNHIESRNINGVNIHDISEKEFDHVCQCLDDNNIKINCFGSTVANWSKDPRKEEDFQKSKEELTRAIARMRVLGTEMIRGMSFVHVRDEEPDAPHITKQVFAKVRELVKMCEDAGVIYLQENCANFGGMSYEHTLRLLDAVPSPNFKLCFDTGNPIFTNRRIGPKPWPKQDSFEFYKNVREFIHHVHIKDGIFIRDSETNIFAECEFTYPGEGHGKVKEIVADLLKTGYQGDFSIEPHMKAVFHDTQVHNTDEAKYKTYVEYGKRFMKLYREAGGSAP